MIKVLTSWEDLGKSIGLLHKEKCGYHKRAVKNWDLAQISKLLSSMGKNIRILDMGCSGSQVLQYCHKKGYENIFGIDLNISILDRLRQLLYIFTEKKIPYRLKNMDLMHTSYPNEFFDFIICLSVIEHGVDVEKMLKESSRILKSKGILFITTDYWEPKIITKNNQKLFNLDWNIFSKNEIKNLLKIAKKYGLTCHDDYIPQITDKFIYFLNESYTFISITLYKE
jgi:2-polyprenyl-3-methyl-5-hydroxy-6-metoxy-1,4-benzoquinol methylase